jgi:phosphate starvation-inducible PhoH-like protein
VLAEVDDIFFARLTSEDVVRHTLVGRIVDAYTKYDEEKQARGYERTQDAEAGNRAQRRGHGPQDHKAPGPERPRRRR